MLLVVALLNHGIGIIDHLDTLNIARLNLSASRAAMETASFEEAEIFLKTGIKVLPANVWQCEYQLALELLSRAAESCYRTGHYEDVEKFSGEVVANANSLEDKFRANFAFIRSVCAQNDAQKACDMTEQLLREYGCKFPRRFHELFLVKEVVPLLFLRRTTNPEDIPCMSELKNTKRLQAMWLLQSMSTYAFLAESPLLPFCAFKLFRWTLTYGLSELAPVAFAGVACGCAIRLKDYKKARSYAECALALLEANEDYTSVKAITLLWVNGLALHNCAPLERSLRGLLDGYNAGMAVGDTESASFSIVLYLETSFNLGKHLPGIASDLDVYMEQMKVFGQWQQYTVAFLLRNITMRSLMGGENTEAMDVGTDKRSANAKLFKELDAAGWMCNDEDAADRAIRLKTELSRAETDVGVSNVDFTESFVAISCYGAARKTKKRKYVKFARSAQTLIQTKIKKGNPNLLHWESLIDAEMLALKGRTDAARLKYQAAISFSARTGQINIHGLANERYGDYMAEIGDYDEARYRYENASKLYDEWGAMAKVDIVKEKLARILDERKQPAKK
ncbi:MAG: hypothetical protein SGILL_008935 [Bacillariaceae sp.]